MSTFSGVLSREVTYGFHWSLPPDFYVRDIGFFSLEELSHPAFASVVFEDSTILRLVAVAFPQRPSLEEFCHEDIFVMLAKYLAREDCIMQSLSHDPYVSLRGVKNISLPEFTPRQRDVFREIYRKEYNRRMEFCSDMRFLDLLARKQAKEDKESGMEVLDLSYVKSRLYKGTSKEEAFFIEAYKEAYRHLLIVQKIFS